MKVASYIPIKLNNQRLPGKNTKLLNGKPLCAYLFDTISQVAGIDEKYVFCSDEAIIPYLPPAIRFLKRDARLDSPRTKNLEIIGEFVKAVEADIYVLAHVTSPFLKASSLETAVGKVKSGAYDSALSVEEIRGHCWYAQKPLNFDAKNIANTQQLQPVMLESVGFYVFRKEVFCRMGQRTGNQPYLHAVDSFESIDIDTPEDFAMAEVLAEYLARQEQK